MSEVLISFGRFTCFMRLLRPNGIARSLEPRPVHRAATPAHAAAADARPRRGDKALWEGARSWHDERTSAGNLNPPPSWGKHRKCAAHVTHVPQPSLMCHDTSGGVLCP